jgi:tetratricopeptide (TPR) repeat protein
MKKKKFLLASLFLIFFVTPNYGKTALRDQLPNLLKLDDYTIGAKRVEKAIKYENRGKYKKANKLYSQALKYFLLANENSPTNSSIYFYLGFISKKLEKIIDAEIYYSLGIEVDPNNSKINNYLGQLYLETNRLDKAKETLKIIKNCNCEDFYELEALISNN